MVINNWIVPYRYAPIVLKKKFITLNTHNKKLKKSKIDTLISQLKKLKKQKQTNSKTNKKQK